MGIKVYKQNSLSEFQEGCFVLCEFSASKATPSGDWGAYLGLYFD